MRITRRTFVKGGLAVPVLPVLAEAGCGNDVEPPPYLDVKVTEDPTSLQYGKVALDLGAYPQLAAVGGALTLRIAKLNNPAVPFSVPRKGILVIHRDASDGSAEFVATRADCPHQGCALGYSSSADLIECPCHGSRFVAVGASNLERCAGRVVHGPALDDLRVYGVERRGNVLLIELGTDQSCGVEPLPPVVDGTVTLTVAKFPALAMVGGSVIGLPPGLGDKLIISRIDDVTMTTLSSVCTHVGCDVELDLAEARMHCPCHKSNFTLDGVVIDGPAPLPLRRYVTTFDGETIVISTT